MPTGTRPPWDRSVGAVVTAFRSGPALLDAVAGVLGQAALVVVVDDGSPDRDDALLDACAAAGAVVVRRETNGGIGAALNTGVRAVLDGAPDVGLVLTLDQDSVLPDGYVAALRSAGAAASAAGYSVGMVGPEAAGRVAQRVRHGHAGVLLSREPIQSGLLLPREVLDELGPFASRLFIDGVDTEYFLRARAAGHVAVVAPGARIEHELGTAHPVGAGGGPAVVVAAPFRYYFIARNRWHLVRRYGRGARGWAVGAVLRDLRHLAVVTLLVPGRAERWRQVAAGLRDGRRGVLGPRP